MRLVTVIRLWLPWLSGNLARLAGVIGGVFYLLVTIGLILDSNAAGGGVATAPIEALVWTLWLGTIFLVMALPAAFLLQIASL